MAGLLNLFWTFFKIGLFTFGGGYAMIPMITDAVLANQWMPLEAIVDFIAVSESTPGPFAINIATFIGSQQAGLVGSAVATTGVVLPCFVISILISKFLMGFQDNKYVKGALQGIRPVVVGLIGAATLTVFLTAIFPAAHNIYDVPAALGSTNLIGLGILVVLIIVNKFKKLHPVALIVISAAMGVAAYGAQAMLFA